MVKEGFPNFGMSQAGAFVTALKNYQTRRIDIHG